MKVLLRRNVQRLGQIGEVVDVKNGYARNYLIPQGLAARPTKGNIAAVEAEKQRYLEEVAHQREHLQQRATALEGKEITITARANEEGHLYGSVGPAQIVGALAEEGIFIERNEVVLKDPIRKLDKYDVQIQFDEGISGTIYVWIVPAHAENDQVGSEPPSAPHTPEEEPEATNGEGTTATENIPGDPSEAE